MLLTLGRVRTIFPKPLEQGMALVDSTSNERTVNNVVRHEYRVLTDTEKSEMKAVKDQGLELIDLLNAIGNCRELSIAKTKIEEAVMWAVKAITK
jgi:hypothetical protein